MRRVSHIPDSGYWTGVRRLGMERSYRGSGTTGGRWGCGLASIICATVGLFLIGVNTLGDCKPGVACHHIWTDAVLPTALLAAVIGLGARFLINLALERRRKRDR